MGDQDATHAVGHFVQGPAIHIEDVNPSVFRRIYCGWYSPCLRLIQKGVFAQVKVGQLIGRAD